MSSFSTREVSDDAFERVVATVPDTLQGAVAALRYVREWFEQGHCLEEENCVALIGSVERAIRNAIVARFIGV